MSLTSLFHQISSSPMLLVIDEYEQFLSPILQKAINKSSIHLKYDLRKSKSSMLVIPFHIKKTNQILEPNMKPIYTSIIKITED